MSGRQVPFMVPTLGEEEAQAARQAVLSGWVTQGPRVAEFEGAFAAFTGAAHACAVSNCTAALHLALLSAGVGPDDVVLTVSHSFIATANAVRHCGAEPVFVDIDPATCNMDPDLLARALARDFEARDGGLWYAEVDRLAQGESPLVRQRAARGRLAAILVVHQVGLPADLGRILPLARLHGLPLLEDAACALGSQVSLDNGATFQGIGRPHGLAACFSFHPRKVITTGDGGMITTSSPELDRRYRLLRQHGMAVPDLARHHSREVILESYLSTGFNYRLTDIQAAVGLAQMARLDDMVARRRHLAGLYQQALAGEPGLTLPGETAYARHNWQTYVAVLDDPARQRPVMQALLDQGVATRRGIMSAHLEPPYRAAWPRESLPQSTWVSEAGLCLPLFPGLREEDLEYVVDCLRRALRA